MRPELVRPTKKRTRDNDRRSQRRPCRRWKGWKICSSASAPAAFLPDLLLAGAVQCPGTGSQVVVQEAQKLTVPLLSVVVVGDGMKTMSAREELPTM